MVVKGQQNCDFLKAQTPGTDAALAPTYYDAERVYLQIAEYTKVTSWQTCAAAAEVAYRDSYVMRADLMGSVPGYWNFSNGVRKDWQATADPKSKDAVNALSLKASYCAATTPIAWTAAALKSREVSYCIRALDDSEAVGTAHNARMDALLGQVLDAGGHIDQWLSAQAVIPLSMTDFDGPAACIGQNYFQPFMAGITMNVMMQAWERTHDARIPPKVKALADYIWAQAYDPVKKALWYENCSAPGTTNWMLPKNGAPDLNLMIAPAFAWLWKQTGEVKYQTEGDALFEGGVLGAYLEQGKQFNQNYSESFNYVLWRSSAPTPITFATERARVKPVPKSMRPSTKPFPEPKRK